MFWGSIIPWYHGNTLSCTLLCAPKIRVSHLAWWEQTVSPSLQHVWHSTSDPLGGSSSWGFLTSTSWSALCWIPMQTGDLRRSLSPPPFSPDSLLQTQCFTCTDAQFCPSHGLCMGSPLPPTSQLGSSLRAVSWRSFKALLICSLSPMDRWPSQPSV